LGKRNSRFSYGKPTKKDTEAIIGQLTQNISLSGSTLRPEEDSGYFQVIRQSSIALRREQLLLTDKAVKYCI